MPGLPTRCHTLYAHAHNPGLSVVDPEGFEPSTITLQAFCSTVGATSPVLLPHLFARVRVLSVGVVEEEGIEPPQTKVAWFTARIP